MTEEYLTQISGAIDELKKIEFQMSISGQDTYHLDIALSNLAIFIGCE